MEFPGCYNSPPPTEDLVPRSWTIRGRGGEKRESTFLNTTNKGLCSMSNDDLRQETFRRETATSENETIRCQEDERQRDPDQKDSVPTQNREDTRQEDGGQGMTKMYTRVGETKGTTGIPKPEIGIETIRCKQGIVTIPKLHLLETLDLKGIRRELKHLRHLS